MLSLCKLCISLAFLLVLVQDAISLPCNFFVEMVTIEELKRKNFRQRRCIKGSITRMVMEQDSMGFCRKKTAKNLCNFSKKLLFIDPLVEGVVTKKSKTNKRAMIEQEDDGTYVVSLRNPSEALNREVGWMQTYKFRLCILGDFGDMDTKDVISPGPGSLSAFDACANLNYKDK